VYTLLSKSEIDTLKAEHEAAPHLRLLQKALAEDVTVRVHSRKDYEQAVEASNILFGKGTTEALQALPEKLLLQILEGVPSFSFDKAMLDQTVPLVQLVSDVCAVFPSRGEARKMIVAGGFSLNKTKYENDQEPIGKSHLLNGKYLLVQKGKKQYFLLSAV